MKINPVIADKAMEKQLLTEEDIASHMDLKLKSTKAILSGKASTSRNNVIKICKLLKVSFAAMKPEEVK